MLIAVISDSHNNNKAVDIIKKELIKADMVLFLGDGINDFVNIRNELKGEFYGVCGNCDFNSEYPIERIVEVQGKKIFMTHGHRYNVKMDYTNILFKGREVEADIVLFGHTHLAMIEKVNNMILMNPGSINNPAGLNERTIGYIDIKEDKEIDVYLKKVNL